MSSAAVNTDIRHCTGSSAAQHIVSDLHAGANTNKIIFYLETVNPVKKPTLLSLLGSFEVGKLHSKVYTYFYKCQRFSFV